MSAGNITKLLRDQICLEARNCCGSCRSHQRYVLGLLEIEHIIPIARGGSDQQDNLWLACRLCNNFKGIKTHGQDPETQVDVSFFNLLTQNLE